MAVCVAGLAREAAQVMIKRASLANASLVAASILVGTLLIEVFLRAQQPFLHLIDFGVQADDYMPSPYWDHTLVPHVQHRIPPIDDRFPEPVVFRTNGMSCPDSREYPLPRAAGEKHVLLVGDSFVEGANLPAGYVLNQLLEEELNRGQTNTRFRVMNCGCSSYSPLLIYLRLKGQLLALRPDVLVVSVDLTDIFDDNQRYKPYTAFSDDGTPLYTRRFSQRQTATRTRLRKLSYIYALAGQATRRFRTPAVYATGDDVFGYFLSEAAYREHGQEVQFTLSAVERILNLAAAEGIRTLVTVPTHLEQLQPDGKGRVWHRMFEADIERLSRSHGAGFVSPFERLQKADVSGMYYRNDMHFSPLGEKVWAQSIVDGLRALRDLPVGRGAAAAAMAGER